VDITSCTFLWIKFGGGKVLTDSVMLSPRQEYGREDELTGPFGLLIINNIRRKTTSIIGAKVTEKQWQLVRNQLIIMNVLERSPLFMQWFCIIRLQTQ
jgi:hypothetical protein